MTLAPVVFAAALLFSPATGQEAKKGGKKGFRAKMPEVLAFDDNTGFESIFDGTLKGWDGNPDFWRAEGGSLIGETTAAKPLKLNTFLIWRGGAPGDFELKLEFKMNSTNSGVQYRSVELPDVGQWVLKGYQADIDFDNRYTGQLYEERGRGFLAMRGQMSRIETGKAPGVVGSLGSSDELKAHIKQNDWNQFQVVAVGNLLTHIINGHVMAVAVDDDAANRTAGGLLGFQIHVGPPMKIEFRNIYLKKR
ncbi:MAG: DUF1080 domain-containing protein [Bryobacteraceae bacterium]